jgi:molybdate transport system permease protein
MNWTEAEIAALCLSLKVSTFAVILILPFAVICAWLLARYQFKGKFLFEALVTLPLVLPPVVTGYFLLVLFGRNGYIGAFLYEGFGVQLSFSWQGAALASAVVSFPLAVRSIRQSFENIDARYDLVAQTHGASTLRRFFSIHLPLARAGLISGSLLAFARSLGEFGATVSFVGNIQDETRTIPLAIYSAMQQADGDDSSMRLVVLSVLVAVLAMGASEYLSRKASLRK